MLNQRIFYSWNFIWLILNFENSKVESKIMYPFRILIPSLKNIHFDFLSEDAKIKYFYTGKSVIN